MEITPNTILSDYNTNNQKYNNKSNSYNNQTNFKGFGDIAVATMDFVDRGGLFASFTIQDMLGTNFPRTYVGLNRNKDVTGKYNFKEASEVALREFMTGPSMFIIPMIMVYGSLKIGSSLDVPGCVQN